MMESESSREEEEEEACFLDVYVHEARNIHNYADQDVYAKLALTSAPDHAPALSTRATAAAGPRFDERLPPLRVRRGRIGVDVLKCELWTRTPPLLEEDQLLGFALVPLAAVADADGARIAGRDFELSSTELLHSPAGTVRLSLALHSGGHGFACAPPDGNAAAEPSITSEVVILQQPTTVVDFDYSGIEFPDLNVVKENHDMAVQYLPFLQLGVDDDGEKTASSSGVSKNASTTTTASEPSSYSSANMNNKATEKPVSCRSPETPTSSSSNGKAGIVKEKTGEDDVFTSPLGGIIIDLETEQSEMQRQIMEMYVKSMQQFSESLPKVAMMPTDHQLAGGDGVVVQKEKKQQVKNEGARVFYGSRAFF